MKREDSKMSNVVVENGRCRLDLLTLDQKYVVNGIIQTARRWLAIPTLREHAAKTLDFYGERYEGKI